MSDIKNLRNIAIIAHVDHGKTTLVDKLLQQSGALGDRAGEIERVMDSNALESERGITILAKNTAIKWLDKRTDTEYRINIVDTPGHADFGGEVERVMSMVDCVLLLVDSQEGPMPQTRFVTQKAFARGLKPIVIINKVDKPSARCDWVIDQVFDLFDNLGATDEQLDFPIVYASGLRGVAGPAPEELAEDMTPLFETIVDIVEPPAVDVDGPFQMQISSLDYNSFVGVIGVGRIQRGSVKLNTPVTVIDKDGNTRNGRILKIMGYHGLERVDVESASAGDIVCITGIDALNISDTVCDPKNVEALPALSVDEPTVSMTFQVNNSPFAGKEGKFVTSRNIRERLDRELIHNVALRVEDTDSPDRFKVSGRGELHLSVLIENMRREGFEMGVSRPQVIIKEIDGAKCEPIEELTIDLPENVSGRAVEFVTVRKGEMLSMEPKGERMIIKFNIPSRGIIGLRNQLLTATAGEAIMSHRFLEYQPFKGEIPGRTNGSLISMENGKAIPYSIDKLQDRGKFFVDPNEDIYEGQVIGENSRGDDMVVNVTKTKKLTNVRSSGADDKARIIPAIKFSLEEALEYIQKDEYVEVTPKSIRLRKIYLNENDRKRFKID
ncbi:MAG TPA: translational GTPase TypA [Acinetobacter sp.]|nr:translational GTPase TypA [Acinetobacter sp.]